MAQGDSTLLTIREKREGKNTFSITTRKYEMHSQPTALGSNITECSIIILLRGIKCKGLRIKNTKQYNAAIEYNGLNAKILLPM